VKTKLTITGGTGFENLFKDAGKQQEHSPRGKPHAISRVKVVGMQSGLIEPEVSSIPHQIPQDVEQVLIDTIRGLRLERKGQCQCVDALEKAGLQQ